MKKYNAVLYVLICYDDSHIQYGRKDVFDINDAERANIWTLKIVLKLNFWV